ncbi:hypothetical protein TURU_012216 [Turdus rufiventris]|nr:hypothetical protein TURU_012216 [Turdus rufiventris]
MLSEKSRMVWLQVEPHSPSAPCLLLSLSLTWTQGRDKRPEGRTVGMKGTYGNERPLKPLPVSCPSTPCPQSLSSPPGAPLGPGRGSELSLEPSPLQLDLDYQGKVIFSLEAPSLGQCQGCRQEAGGGTECLQSLQACGPRVTELITKPVSASKVLKGLSFPALKKVLAIGHYDVKNIRHIKLGLKKLVSKGTLVQTKGAGTSSSFKLSKNLVVVVKSPKRKMKKLAATAAKKAAKSPKKDEKAGSPKKAGYPKKAAKGSAKAKAVKPKARKA